jgi:hypothetical protein
LSGFENQWVAVGLWTFAALWTIAAIITWEPVHKKCYKIRLLKLTMQPAIPANMDKVEAKELLRYYSTQKQNWQNYIRLKLLDVDCSYINEASPYVLLKLEIVNFLSVPLRFIRVTGSSGIVDGQTLPSLPENHDVKVSECSEKQFTIRLDLQNTGVPGHLSFREGEQAGRYFQWIIKGEWVVEIFGECQTAWYPNHELIINAKTGISS